MQLNKNLKIETALKVLLRKAPLLGCIAQEMHREPNSRIDTLGVGFDKQDGKLLLLYNEDFVNNIPSELLVEVVLPHEIAHVVNGHLERYTKETTAGIPPAVVNIAMDMAINNDSYIQMGRRAEMDGWLSQHFNSPGAGAIYPDNYGYPEKKTSDFYLAELLEHAPKQGEAGNLPNPGKGNGEGSGNGDGESSGNGDGESESSDSDSVSDSGSDSDSASDSDSDSVSDSSSDSKPGENAGEGKTGDKESGGQHPFLEQNNVSKNTKASIARSALANAYKEWTNSGKHRGNMPGGVAEKIEEYLFPKKPISQVFRHLIGSWVGSSWMWSSSRINKRTGNYESPGKRLKPKLHLALVIDTSGSMSSQDLALFRGMVKRVQRELNPQITLLHTDTEVQKEETIRGTKIPVDFHGRGGTSFTPAFRYMREKGIKPDGVIFFTDGHGDLDTSVARGFRTAWIITPGGSDYDFMHKPGMKIIEMEDCK